MKKLTLPLVAVSLAVASLGAYAAVPTGAAPFQVVVPNLASGFMFTLEGMYVQPTNSNLSYANSTLYSGNTTNTQITDLKPEYNFGFRAGVGYIFPNTGNDVQLSWTHFDHSDDAASITGDLADIEPYNHTTTADVSFKYDAIDLDVGQYVSVGTRLQNRLFIGVRGAELKKDTNTTDFYNNAPNFAETGSFNSKFIGIGPRVGIDTSYNVGNCIGIVGHFATALLVGNVDLDGTATYYGRAKSAPAPTQYTTTYTADTQTRVVPAFDAKLGVDYTVLFNNSAASSLSVEAGYQVTQYLNAIDELSTSSQLKKSDSQSSRTSSASVTTSNLGFHGPYLSVNVRI